MMNDKKDPAAEPMSEEELESTAGGKGDTADPPHGIAQTVQYCTLKGCA